MAKARTTAWWYSELDSNLAVIARKVTRALDSGRRVMIIGKPGTGAIAVARNVAGAYAASSSSSGRPPFRAPHYTAHLDGMVGGRDRPGEVVLAHASTLIMADWPEFSRHVCAGVLRAWEDKSVTRQSDGGQFTTPSDFRLIATATPCPCSGRSACRCDRHMIARFKARCGDGWAMIDIPA